MPRLSVFGHLASGYANINALFPVCKTCIVRYLESSKYCPICDVQIHKTKPLQNIRSDQTLQNIVYKIVPGLFQNEMRQRREFYARHPGVSPVSEYDAGVINEETSCIFSPDETVALCLEYSKSPLNSSDSCKESDQNCSSINKECNQQQQHRRYLRCPAAVTVLHLKKLLRSKYGLSSEHRVDLFYNDELLREDFSLMDIAYIYLWRRKGPMHLTYRIFERPHKRRKLDFDRDKVAPLVVGMDIVNGNSVSGAVETKGEVEIKAESERLILNQIPSVHEIEQNDKKPETEKVKSDTKPCSDVEQENNDEWKEVQLQISENGVMSVRNIDDLVSAVEVGVISGSFNETIISSGKVEENPDELGKAGLETCVLADKGSSELEVNCDLTKNTNEASLTKQENKDMVKSCVTMKPVSSVDNKESNDPSSAILSSSNAIVGDKVSGPRVCDSSKLSFSKKENHTKLKEGKCKYPNNTNGLNLPASDGLSSPHTGSVVSGSVSPSVSVTSVPPHTVSSCSPVSAPLPKRPNSSPVGYKTLKTPPKSWNPSIPRATILANHATFGKASMAGNVNGSVATPGQSLSSKFDCRSDGKANSNNVEGGSGSNNGVKMPPASSPKPLRFFRMRNNMPRYLGNPSSGVKPMYQVQPGGAASAAAPVTPKPPQSATKVDSKVSSAPQLPTSSTMTEGKQDKIGSITSKVSFPLMPSSKINPKSPSGLNSMTGFSPSQSVASTFTPTPVSTISTSHTTQLPTTRTSHNTPPYSVSTTLAGYHPSLPPSISMIFGPSRPGTNERPSSQTPPPAVQRVPASVHHPHHFHHPLAPLHLLQHRQTAKTSGKLNGELSSSEVRSSKGAAESPGVVYPVLEIHKGKEGPSRESTKEPVNGKIEGSNTTSKSPSVVEGKSLAPSKC
ncbi:hypothetical protein J437_LFUL017840 [Ladona fulva]|uniref:RAWUL domain-containing protein n=1 Tax=Ladona fulva TaxID=123851 RepID=A0A8K0KLV7_LADFU|nr:hypothetical protein J437_LFUL017840 [Ladona fulva]